MASVCLTSGPVMMGICTSENTMSTGAAIIASSPFAPFSKHTTLSKPICSSMRSMSLRMVSVSSTTIAVRRWLRINCARAEVPGVTGISA